MKRRLAVLLALTLTFASLSPAGAAAAEAEQPQEQIVEDVSAVEEAADEAEEEAAPESEDSAQEATTVTIAAEEETEEVVEETVDEEEEAQEQTGEADPAETEAADTAETEAAETDVTDPAETEAADTAATEAADTAATDTETAAEEEPSTVQEEEAAIEIEDNALVIEEAVVNAVGVEAMAAVKRTSDYFWRNPADGKRYFFYKTGKKATGKGWITFTDGNRYYIGADGAAYEGFKKIGGKTYYFWDGKCKTKKPQGAMMTGWQLISGKRFYFADSRYPGLSKGVMLTGWRKIQGNMYFFANSLYPSMTPGTSVTGFRTIDGRKYYFNSRGVRLTGFQEIKGNTYYFVDKAYSAYNSSKEGIMLTASKKIGDSYYFFNEYGAMKQNGWVKYNGLVGHFKADGKASTGWKEKNEGDWYYLKENGFSRTGWLKLNSSSIFYLKGSNYGRMADAPTKMSDGKLYFFNSDGRRATTEGWKAISPYYYYTYADGTCAVNTTIDGIKLDSNGRTKLTKMDMKAQGYDSDTNYLILVDKSTYTVCIYKGRKGAWVRVKGEWPCTHGGSSTPEGEKYIVGRLTKRSETYGWADFKYSSAAFTMELSSGNFIHSVLFEKGTRGNPYNEWIMDPDMYMNYSKGCIRLQLPNAEWVWDNVPKGTKVVVYRSN